MIDEFADAEQGGFFYTGKSHEALIARTKDLFDNATPSGNAMAATALVRLGALTGRDDLRSAGRAALEAVKVVLENAPSAAGQSLVALDFELSPDPRARRDRRRRRARVPRRPRRHPTPAFFPEPWSPPQPGNTPQGLAALIPLLADRPARDERTTTTSARTSPARNRWWGLTG